MFKRETISTAAVGLVLALAPAIQAATVGIDWTREGQEHDQGSPYIQYAFPNAEKDAPNSDPHTLTDALGAGKDVTWRVIGAERVRTRDPITSGTEISFSNLLRDFVGSGDDPGTQDFSLNLTLPTGTYDLTTYHHNTSGSGDNSGFALDVDVTDTSGTTLIVAAVTASRGTTVNSFGTFTTQVDSNGSDPIVLNYNVDGIAAADHWPLNGVLIEEVLSTNAIPEPSTLAMAALGLLGLAVCGWRRKRRRA